MPSMRPRLASVTTGALILYGCAAHPVDFERATVPGFIAARAGRPGIVIAAPHGTSDPRTGDMAAELARRTGFGLVVATGFTLEPDGPHAPGRRYQVNRPSEGIPGRPPSQESVSDDARRVYEAYEQRVREAAQGHLTFYAEIHGNNRQEAADRIEVATVGVDREQAQRLRTLFELVRDAHLKGQPSAPRLQIRVEPADPILYAATGAKREGILRLPDRALHIELPRSARMQWQETYTQILADFLEQAVALTTPR
jgi:hypothetical protein